MGILQVFNSRMDRTLMDFIVKVDIPILPFIPYTWLPNQIIEITKQVLLETWTANHRTVCATDFPQVIILIALLKIKEDCIILEANPQMTAILFIHHYPIT